MYLRSQLKKIESLTLFLVSHWTLNWNISKSVAAFFFSSAAKLTWKTKMKIVKSIFATHTHTNTYTIDFYHKIWFERSFERVLVNTCVIMKFQCECYCSAIKILSFGSIVWTWRSSIWIENWKKNNWFSHKLPIINFECEANLWNDVDFQIAIKLNRTIVLETEAYQFGCVEQPLKSDLIAENRFECFSFWFHWKSYGKTQNFHFTWIVEWLLFSLDMLVESQFMHEIDVLPDPSKPHNHYGWLKGCFSHKQFRTKNRNRNTINIHSFKYSMMRSIFVHIWRIKYASGAKFPKNNKKKRFDNKIECPNG